MNDAERDAAYLVSRGVRTVAIVDTCEGSRDEMMLAATRIGAEEIPNTIPFVIELGEGIAEYGFARAQWAVDLLKWSARVPAPYCHQVRGLLLGYDAESIRAFGERGAGLQVLSPIE